jgi:hypothetical protein
MCVTQDGTQVTTKTSDVIADTKESCQAIVTTQIAICEPMTDGQWKLIAAFKDNYNIVLKEREPDKAKEEVIQAIEEIKNKWKKENRIVCLENFLTCPKIPEPSSTEIKE